MTPSRWIDLALGVVLVLVMFFMTESVVAKMALGVCAGLYIGRATWGPNDA